MTTTPNIAPCRVPTMYFIGVSTGKSSIMTLFPRWAELLDVSAELVGFDAPPGAPADTYRAIVQHIKTDPLARGALVTTHKIDLLAACRDLFDQLDPNAVLTGEVSCISKQAGQLLGAAVDPISSRLAWQNFVPEGHWAHSGGHVLCLGAGGAAAAISVAVAGMDDRPQTFILVERDPARLEHARALHRKLETDINFEYALSADPLENDRRLAQLPVGSMVINATGMGKDRPGSPLTDAAVFPENGLVWELNYRGELTFLAQAQRQAVTQGLIVEDGWVYFLHGWTQVIARVFHLDLTPVLFRRLADTAETLRG